MRNAQRNQYHGYLYGEIAKPGARPIAVDAVLDRWAKGLSCSQIRQEVTRPDGQRFTERGIYTVILRAREEGDPRAEKRRSLTQNQR
jgi:hypothetical protein